jgi:hypothetical protein
VNSEYLLVDMLNNFDELAEDEDHVFPIARRKLSQFDAKKLQKALQDYGSAATRRLMKSWLNELDVAQAEAVE